MRVDIATVRENALFIGLSCGAKRLPQIRVPVKAQIDRCGVKRASYQAAANAAVAHLVHIRTPS
jgi:hypothetical protein